MEEEELKKLVTNIKNLKTETQTIELKAAVDGCPTKLFDTLSSFSNQDSGGIIIFGIDEKDNYAIKGVYDAHDLQAKINAQCKQMEPAVRPLFTVCNIDGKVIVSAEIPSVDLYSRPVFYKGVGRIKGSYIRIGEADEPMNEYEIYSYEALRKRIRDELRTIENCDLSLIDQKKLSDYILAIKKERKNLSENVSNNKILDYMGVTKDGIFTLAGLLTFSKYPQAYFPQLCITAVSVPGTEISSQENVNERFIDNKRITGSISDMLDEAVEFVRRNCRTKTIITSKGERFDKEEYPIRAVREAILNALVHRDYSIYSENIPIRIEMYRDRMEITNSGGLYGNLTIDKLGKVRPETRNAALANMLEILHVTENRYSGIPTILSEFASERLPMPIFSSLHGEFKVIMKNGIYEKEEPMIESLLYYCFTPRSREEIASFMNKSKNYVMSQIVTPLIKSGKLKMTMPDKPKSAYQKYVKA